MFQYQVEEALDNVKIAIRNLKEFKTCFQEYKMKIPSYFPSDVPPVPWEFQVTSSFFCMGNLFTQKFYSGITGLQTIRQFLGETPYNDGVL